MSETDVSVIKNDIKNIRQGIDRIDNHLNKLNSKVAKNRLNINTNSTHIETVMDCIDDIETERQKNKFVSKEQKLAFGYSLVTALIVSGITVFFG